MTRTFFFVALLASSLVASTAGAQSDADRARAHEEFERGVAAYTANDYRTALDAFQEAYRLAPHASVRLNIAHCYEQLDRPVEALFHFEHYLTEASSVTGAQRREIEGTIRDLRRRTGTITLQVTPDGATIVIDGSETRRAPVSEPVRVTAGDHSVVITLDGYATERQTVHVEGGGDARVAVRLQRGTVASSTTGTTGTTTTTTTTEEPTTTTTTTTETTESETEVTTTTTETTEVTEEPVPESSGGGVRFTAPVFIAGGVTVAAGIAWGITGGLALSENSAFEGDVATANDTSLSNDVREAARVSGRGHADSARTLAIVSDVMMVTTLVGLGATTFFFILAQTEEDEPSDSAAVLVPVFTASPDGSFFAGASAAGRF